MDNDIPDQASAALCYVPDVFTVIMYLVYIEDSTCDSMVVDLAMSGAVMQAQAAFLIGEHCRLNMKILGSKRFRTRTRYISQNGLFAFASQI